MYLEIDEGFPEHAKTIQLCAAMGNPLAFGHLLHLWRWASRCCKSGDLRGMSPYVIEEAARYPQHDGKLYAALVAKLGDKAGFIDVDENGNPVSIHNWTKRTGGAIKRMDDEAERKKLYRAHKDKKCGQSCQFCAKESGQSADSPRTVDRTSSDETPPRPVQTSPDQSRPDKSRSGDQDTCSEPSRSKASEPVLVFPCDGQPNSWSLTQEQIAEWSQLYPSLDVIGEARAALAWVKASPDRRKTARGMAKFLVGWLSRSQNTRRGQTTSLPGIEARVGHARAEDCTHEKKGEIPL